MTKILADKRKPDCRYYEQCLDQAARANEDLLCTGCLRYEHQDHNPDDKDICGSYALVAAVFRQQYTDETPQELVDEFRTR